MEQIEEDRENQPTIEEVKKIVDSRRQQEKLKRSPSKTYTREDRIKNLEIAREIKKKSNTKTNETQNKLSSKPESNTDIKPIITKVDDTKISLKPSNNDNDIINELEKLFKNQNEYIEKIINDSKKKPAIKRNHSKKVKEPKKTLDFTITDNDIKNIIDNKNNEVSPIKDNKLQAFLEALKK